MGYLGVVGGSSFLKSKYFLESKWEQLTETTPYGKLAYYLDSDHGIIFVQRHHADPDVDYSPPHAINRKAIIWGLQQLECDKVIAFCSTGAMNPAIALGSVVVPNDFLCLERTNFYEDYRGHNVPGFDDELRNGILKVLRDNKITHVADACYYQSQGPRFETAAEIKLFAQSSDIVGMTTAQEAVLAREIKLPFAAICMVDNIANGVKSSSLTFDDFHNGVKDNQENVEKLLSLVLNHFAPKSTTADGVVDTRIKVDKVVNARWVVPMTAKDANDQRVLEKHSVVVDINGEIVDVLPTDEVQQKYNARITTDLSKSHVVLPGLINCHSHLGMTMLRGFADDLDLLPWLTTCIWPAEMKFMSPDFVSSGVKLGAYELLRSGTTTVNDAYFCVRATIDALMEMGMRAIVGAPVLDIPSAEAGVNMLQDNIKTIQEFEIEKTNAKEADKKRYDLCSFAIMPHAPYTVGDETLSACLKEAKKLDIPIHIHLHETQAEAVDSAAQNRDSAACHRSTKPITPLQNLDELGLTKHKLIAAHMTAIHEQEQFDIVVQNKQHVKIAHCPCSNMKLASGFCPTARLIENGVDVGIGTDSSASNNSLDMFAETKMAALIAKGFSKDPKAIPAYTALKMATIGAARTVFLDHIIGSLEKGKKADFIAVNFSSAFSLPLYDVISHLVYSTTRDMVEYVWVNGEKIIDNKVLHSNLEEKIKQDALRWNKTLLDFKLESAQQNASSGEKKE